MVKTIIVSRTLDKRGFKRSDRKRPIQKLIKLHKKTLIFIVIIGLIIGGLFYFKGLLVAATVNGSPISRLSVVEELEKRSGKQALESLIEKKLIETELDKKGITVTKEEVDVEIKKIEAQVASQGGTLEAALAQQGMTEEKLREQIIIQKKLRKFLADKIAVTDAEVDSYIKESNVTAPEGLSEEDFRIEISEQLKQQKFQREAQKWVSDLTTNAKIKYYVNY